MITKEDCGKIFNTDPDSLGVKAYDAAIVKDIAFHITRQHLDQSRNPKAHWKIFNMQHSSEKNLPANEVEMLTILNAIADKHDTINTSGDRMLHIGKELNVPEVWMRTSNHCPSA